MNLHLVRGVPFAMNVVHICLEGVGQLCRERPFEAVDYFRTDVAAVRELCGVCERHLRNRLGLADATEEDFLKIVRGDYDAAQPNAFWKSYGVTVWS